MHVLTFTLISSCQCNLELAIAIASLNKKTNVSEPSPLLDKTIRINSYSNMPFFTHHLIANVTHSK